MTTDSADTRIGRKLETLRLSARLSRAALAKRLSPPVHHNTIQKWEKGQRGVDIEWLEQLAPILKTTVQDILEIEPSGAKTGSPALTKGTSEAIPAPSNIYSSEKWPRDLPVMGIGECGPDGWSLWNGEIIQMAPRPPSLAGVPKAYAVYAMGDSMEPRYFAGEIIFIDPAKPVGPGDFVLVQLRPAHEGEPPRALLKRLVRRSGPKVTLEQLSPKKKIEIRTADVVSMHLIVLSGRP